MTESVDTRAEAPSTGAQDGNLAVALIVHYGIGFFWLFGLAGLVGLIDTAAGVVWALCAVPIWIADSVRMVRARRFPGRVWALSLGWWLKSFVSPLFLLLEVLGKAVRPEIPYEPEPMSERPSPAAKPAWNPHPPSPPANDNLRRRLEDFALRLEALERELADLRRSAAASPEAATVPPPVVPPPPTVPEPAPAPVPVAPPPASRPAAQPLPPIPPKRLPPAEPPEPPWWSGLTFADLFSAKVLAWAGGVVTLLGIVFFFVLAVNRGWIGPVARVALGSLASALVFSAGIYVHRRLGHLYYSAYAAVGAGIGGGYATLLAARLRYELVSDWSALIIAAAIAAVGVATALAWSSELIAGLGLVGATLAPAAVGLQSGELSAAGTTFAAFVFAGTAIVAVGRRWQALLAVGVAASLPQVAVLIGQAAPTEWDVVGVAAAFWLLYLTAAIGLQLSFETPDLASLPTSLLLATAVFAGIASGAQFDGHDQGWALLAIAAVYGAAAVLFFPRRRHRDLSALLAAVGLAFVAVGLADLVSGPTLAIAWAAEAAVLAWLARRIGELRYQIASLAYLGAALVHAVVLDAPVRQLYEVGEHPASGGLAFVGVALAGAVVAYYCRPWEEARPSAGVLAPLEPMLDAFRGSQPLWRSLTGWTAALSALYVASLAVLGLAQWLADDHVRRAFGWGHVGVTALWVAVSLAAIAAGHRLLSREVVLGGVLGSLGVVLEVVAFDTSLAENPRRGCYLVLAGAAAALGVSGRAVGEPLCHVAALVSLFPVLAYAVAEAPPDRLYRATITPVSNPELTGLLAFVLAAAIVAYSLRLVGAPAAAGGEWFEPNRSGLRSIAGWSSAVVALYAASLVLLTLAQELGDGSVRSAFEWGHVAVAALWGVAALGVLAAGHRWSLEELRAGGLVWLGVSLLEAVFFVSLELEGDRQVSALFVFAAALLSGSLLDRLRRVDVNAFPAIATYVLSSLGLAVAGFVLLVGDTAAEGGALLALAAFYCLIAALVFARDRDLATLLWAPALGVAGFAWTEVTSGTVLVLAWAATAAALAVVADRAGERRLQLAALAYLAPALGHTLWLEAPPRDFFESTRHPETGVPALLFVVGAMVVFGLFARSDEGARDQLDQAVRARQRGWQRSAIALSTVLLMYAVSLSILGLAEAIGGGTVAARFHGGHSAVSAVWGLVGLVALYAGLSRRIVWLQAVGFGLFAVSLAKIFLYDLTFLSSITRALSFLAVGAVLLLGGFFVQRLGAERHAA